MVISKHAEKRMKQRGFNQDHIDFMLRHGRRERIGEGVRFWVTKRQLRKVRASKYPPAILEKCQGTFLVFCNNTVVTVAHIH